MAMIERTQRRLRQARFFYEHLLNPRRSTMGDPEAFGFYFSAFIQAARSVTWTLDNEEPRKWKAWEPTWKASLSTEEKKLLDVTNKFRIDEAKKGGTKLTMELEKVAVVALVEAIPRNQTQRRQLPGASTKKTIRAVLPVQYLEDEEGKKVVTDLCRRYLEVLQKVVKDFSEQNMMND